MFTWSLWGHKWSCPERTYFC